MNKTTSYISRVTTEHIFGVIPLNLADLCCGRFLSPYIYQFTEKAFFFFLDKSPNRILHSPCNSGPSYVPVCLLLQSR